MATEDKDEEFCVYPCLMWVKQGVSKRLPYKIQVDADELQRVIDDTRGKLTKLGVQDDDALAKRKRKKGKGENSEKKVEISAEDEEIVKKYGLDDYDDDSEDEAEGESEPAYSIASMAYYSLGENDPYITFKDEVDSDVEESEIQPTDNLLVAGMVDNDAALLYVYVYSVESASMCIHHEIILPSYPLCLEWLDFDPTNTSKGSYVAVGSMEPTIDIWDLDVLDSLEPAISLGTPHHGGKKKKKKSVGHGHTDAVLGLSWNALSREHLASASADHTVGVWDLTQARMVTTLRSHSNKVQCAQWSPVEAHSLVTGSFDQTVKLHDGRTQDGAVKSWSLDGEVEKVQWDVFSPTHLYASTEKGTLSYMDTRHKKLIYSVQAHDSPVIGICQSGGVRGMLVTSGSGGEVKVWDTTSGEPEVVATKPFNGGELHGVCGNPDAPFMYAAAGSSKPQVWDIRKGNTVAERFSTQSSHKKGKKKKGNSEPSSNVNDTEGQSQSSNSGIKKRKHKRKNKPTE